MTINDIYTDALAVVDIFSSGSVPEHLQKRIAGDITGALQLMQLAGEDFYSREELDVTLVPNTSTYNLDASVQKVLEPARLASGVSLVALSSRTQFDDFGPLFLGELGAVASDTPVAYFVETTNGGPYVASAPTGNIVVANCGTTAAIGTYIPVGDRYVHDTVPNYYIGRISSPVVGWAVNVWEIFYPHVLYYGTAAVGVTPDLVEDWTAQIGSLPVPAVTAEMSAATGNNDPTHITIRLVPTPDESTTLTLNVIKEPPTYDYTDVNSTGIIPPVPHKYHESILRPLVRRAVATSSYFTNKDMLPTIEADYQRALTLLGLADPRSPKPPGAETESLKK